MEIGKNVEKYRMEKGMKREELAELAFVNLDYLRAIEEGRKIPAVKTIARIADRLGVSIEDLLKK